MADVDAPECLRVQAFGQRAGIEIVHVLGDRDMRGDKGVEQEQVEVFEQVEAFFRDVPVGVRGIPHPRPACIKDEAAGIRRGVLYKKWRDCDPEQIEWYIGLHRLPVKVQKPECLPTVTEHRVGGKDRGNLLHPVKFAKTHEMIIVPVGPDHGIDMGGAVPEELLPEVWRGIHKDMAVVVFDQDGCPQPLRPVSRACVHWGQSHPIFGVPIASPVPNSVNFILHPVQVTDRFTVFDHADPFFEVLVVDGFPLVHERREESLFYHESYISTRETFGQCCHFLVVAGAGHGRGDTL